MNFDGARGWMVGEPNRGLAAMFTMMNYERLSIGIQGLGLGEVSYQNALEYARDRIQGRAATGAVQPEKNADPIIVHPDVRRMLLIQKSFNALGQKKCFKKSRSHFWPAGWEEATVWASHRLAGCWLFGAACEINAHVHFVCRRRREQKSTAEGRRNLFSRCF